ncbi:hypothetical protein CRG98_027323 [Punica granatum]|uniref:Uncharacterized protein n=1 Tax=Punica granatum TaxID=22663 RepID=A0A2I0J7R2_PUNGR|nr:hypothetical protein CRG98_027323 [Punica granatum]
MDPRGQDRTELEIKSRDGLEGQDRPELEIESRDGLEGQDRPELEFKSWDGPEEEFEIWNLRKALCDTTRLAFGYVLLHARRLMMISYSSSFSEYRWSGRARSPANDKNKNTYKRSWIILLDGVGVDGEGIFGAVHIAQNDCSSGENLFDDEGAVYLYENFPRESGPPPCHRPGRTGLPRLKSVWMSGTPRVHREHLVPILVVHRHFFDDLLDVIIRRFHRTVHLGTVWGGVAMLDFELCIELVDDLVVQVLGVVRDDRRRDPVLGDDVASEKTGYGFCGDRRESDSLDPFGEVINRHQDKHVSVRCFGVDRADHIHPPH